MAVQPTDKLHLVPVDSSNEDPTSGGRRREGLMDGALALDGGLFHSPGEASAARPEQELPSSVPMSAMRVSPRALALSTEHQPIASASRLTRRALLSGDWHVVDMYRRESELRLLLRSGETMISTREQEVLEAVLSGVPDRELSRRLGITRQCVCGHLGNALGKLGAESRFTALQAWRVLGESERGRAGRGQIAEVQYGEHALLSVVAPVAPRPEIEARLSSAETNVAWLVCDGLSNRDIAVERGTAERTVANQVASIFNKLEVSRRFDVAQFLLGLT